MNDLPRSTEWTLEAEEDENRAILESIYRIYCRDKLPNSSYFMGRPSTGFLLSNRCIVTARHVVQGYMPSDIIGLSIYNEKVTFTDIISDGPGGRDVAILKPANNRKGGLELSDDDKLCVGEQMATLGFPYLGNDTSIGHERTIPLLSMGFLSGYDDFADDIETIKYYIINGGVTIGNSGSPVFKFGDKKVIGMVVRKFAPFSLDMAPELAAREPQLIADIFSTYNIVSPSMMYRAICASELKRLFMDKKISLR